MRGFNLFQLIFFEAENVYNRRNIWGYIWNSGENKNDEVEQFRFLPVGGMSIEF